MAQWPGRFGFDHVWRVHAPIDSRERSLVVRAVLFALHSLPGTMHRRDTTMDWNELDDQIDELRQMLHLPDDGLLNEFAHGIAELFTFRAIVWKDVWEKATEIQPGFKGIRYPTREAREAAWTK